MCACVHVDKGVQLSHLLLVKLKEQFNLLENILICFLEESYMTSFKLLSCMSVICKAAARGWLA